MFAPTVVVRISYYILVVCIHIVLDLLLCHSNCRKLRLTHGLVGLEILTHGLAGLETLTHG